MKMLERSGLPRNRIINGRVFKVPNVDFARVLLEGVAYGVIETTINFNASGTFIPYPQVYRFVGNRTQIILDRYTYLVTANIFPPSPTGAGKIIAGGFCSIAADNTFSLLPTSGHNYRRVWTYHPKLVGWKNPPELDDWEKAAEENIQINIGNDVWIGRDCFIKASRPDKPLIIGDGAVIASKSMVVKNVPPYAIVGGNPAQIIKYRFNEKIIESLLRIKWWNWDIDKIHDNFKYFNRVEEFVKIHDK